MFLWRTSAIRINRRKHTRRYPLRLETNDPWLADLVRHVDAGETIIDDLRQSPALRNSHRA